jgi:ABC-type branched-subunit amino acid transport system ATPase component
MSGGEQAMLSIGRGLMVAPKLPTCVQDTSERTKE